MMRRLQHIGITLMVMLFTSYFTATNLYYHVHMEEGKMMVHSHPYHSNSSSSPNHTHTGKECLAIQQMSTQPLLFASAMLHLPERPEVLLALIRLMPTLFACNSYTYPINGRAPPVYSC